MNVEELLRSKHIEYESKGSDHLIRCLNPEHDDSNPSLRINNITGIFQCFSCGFKGNIFKHFGEKPNFLQLRKDLLKSKISQKIAENVGLNLPENFVLFDKEWRSISRETYNAFGAFEHNDSQYIGRVVFPITSISGKITAFCGRALSPDKQPRYLFYPPKAKTNLFPATVEHSGTVILVEGIFDMLNLYDKGLKNVMCSFGTQTITKEKLQILKIQGINSIDIFFDGDEAGQTAAEKVKELAESLEFTTRNIFIPNTDPGALTASKVLKLKEKLYG